MLRGSRGGVEGRTIRGGFRREGYLTWALKNAEEFSVRTGQGDADAQYERALWAQQTTCPLGPKRFTEYTACSMVLFLATPHRQLFLPLTGEGTEPQVSLRSLSEEVAKAGLIPKPCQSPRSSHLPCKSPVLARECQGDKGWQETCTGPLDPLGVGGGGAQGWPALSVLPLVSPFTTGQSHSQTQPHLYGGSCRQHPLPAQTMVKASRANRLPL